MNFMANFYHILQIHHAKSFQMRHITYLYSEVSNRRADQNKQAGLEETETLLAYLLSKLINEQGGIFHFTK